MGNQQGPLYRELCSVLCDSLDGMGVWGKIDTCICMAGFLCFPPETISTLLTDYACMLSHFSHVQLFATLDCNPPSSSVHGSLQARILEWFAMTSSRGSSRPMDWTHVSMSPALAGGVFTTSTSWEVLAIVQDKIKSYKNKIIPKTAVANRKTKGGL